jgi:hypothetical protein
MDARRRHRRCLSFAGDRHLPLAARRRKATSVSILQEAWDFRRFTPAGPRCGRDARRHYEAVHRSARERGREAGRRRRCDSKVIGTPERRPNRPRLHARSVRFRCGRRRTLVGTRACPHWPIGEVARIAETTLCAKTCRRDLFRRVGAQRKVPIVNCLRDVEKSSDCERPEKSDFGTA